MAYQSGTGANVTDFLTALKTFAEAQGWTIVKWDSGLKLLFLEKGNCHAAIDAPTFTNTRVGGNYTDQAVRVCIATSLNPALNTVTGHPGGPTNAGIPNGNWCGCNEMNGPYVAWHFFAGSSPDYIHCTIQVASDRFSHLFIGNLDKRGMTHGNIGYSTRMNGNHYQKNSNLNNSADAFPAQQPFPFLRNTEVQIHPGNALPINWSTFGSGYTNAVMMGLGLYDDASTFPASTDNSRTLDALMLSKPANWSGQAMLWPIPIILFNTAEQEYLYLGDVPNLRYMRMDGLAPGYEFTLGGVDTWKVFPVLRQTGEYEYGATPGRYTGPTTTVYGIAHKKVT